MSKKSGILFTVAQVEALEKRGLKAHWPADMLDRKGKPKRIIKHCPYKTAMLRDLIMVIQEHPDLEISKEFRFCKPQRHRFDFVITDAGATKGKKTLKASQVKIALEYEGIHSAKSRHTTKQGFINDSEKYNLANVLGWIVYRYTANTIQNLKSEIRECLLKYTKTTG